MTTDSNGESSEADAVQPDPVGDAHGDGSGQPDELFPPASEPEPGVEPESRERP